VIGKSAKIVWRCLQILAVSACLVWIGLSLHFQINTPLVYLFYVLLLIWSVALCMFVGRGQWGRLWGMMSAALVIWGLWWTTITPREDRDWAPEVSRGVTSEFTTGGLIRVRNVRDFRWSSPTEAHEAWYDIDVDLGAIMSVDMIMSVWDSADIAHTLVSFGFSDGQHIVFSGEIRKEVGEDFSALGGFFKRYELVLIAADERDIVHLRTDARGETVSLYPIEMGAEQREQLFVAFLEYGNTLATTPQWYHTLWTNCTTLPFRLVRNLSDRVSFDPRIILSGRLPGFLYDLGVLPEAGTLSLDDLKQRAALAPHSVEGLDGVAYSRLLRRNWTGK